VGFLKRASGDKPAEPSVDPIALAREQLRQAGADPDQPHETHHFLYVRSVKAAQQAARALRKPDRRIEIETSARKRFWLVVVTQSIVINPETIAEIRIDIEMAIDLFGGEYDYWQVAVANG
jgi:hypothetical protein